MNPGTPTNNSVWKSERGSQFSSRQLHLSVFKTGLGVGCLFPKGPPQLETSRVCAITMNFSHPVVY